MSGWLCSSVDMFVGNRLITCMVVLSILWFKGQYVVRLSCLVVLCFYGLIDYPVVLSLLWFKGQYVVMMSWLLCDSIGFCKMVVFSRDRFSCPVLL